MIPLSEIVPGVYELQDVQLIGAAPAFVRVSEIGGALFVRGIPMTHSEVLISEVLNLGYEFTARYVRCECEPLPCDCPACHGLANGVTLHCPTCMNRNRGVFIPEAKT